MKEKKGERLRKIFTYRMKSWEHRIPERLDVKILKSEACAKNMIAGEFIHGWIGQNWLIVLLRHL